MNTRISDAAVEAWASRHGLSSRTLRQAYEEAALPHMQQAEGEEVSVEEDVYSSIADMIEPYVRREGSNPDGPLPASIHDSVQIIFDHWLKTRTQAGEVQGDALEALRREYRPTMGDGILRAWAADVVAALAATGKQQGGEISEGEFRASASRQTASAQSNATAEALIAYAREQVGEVQGPND